MLYYTGDRENTSDLEGRNGRTRTFDQEHWLCVWVIHSKPQDFAVHDFLYFFHVSLAFLCCPWIQWYPGKAWNFSLYRKIF